MRISAIAPRFKFAAAASVLAVSAATLVSSATPASAASSLEIRSATNYFNYYVCGSGGHATPTGGAAQVINLCPYRAWLHQYPDGTGWAYCISPNQAVNPAGKYSDAFQVLASSNKANC